jgi:hypothetical protein
MKNSDKPAYPVDSQSQSEHYHGLTKREMFAMAAMQGILANPNWRFSEGWAAGPALMEADELLKQLGE